jgi:pectin lyase
MFGRSRALKPPRRALTRVLRQSWLDSWLARGPARFDSWLACTLVLLACHHDARSGLADADEDAAAGAQDAGVGTNTSPDADRDAAAARDSDTGHDAADAGSGTSSTDGAVPDATGYVEDGGTTGSATLRALAAGKLEVFVNGTSVGTTSADGQLFESPLASMRDGDNVIAVRAARPKAGAAYLRLELQGAFGRLGTNTRWKVKADAAGSSTWSGAGFDDATWPNALEVPDATNAAALEDGPARAIWSANAADDTVWLRVKVFVPAALDGHAPTGFGSAARGGEGGEVVTVTNTTQFAQAVAGSSPRIVQFRGVLDFSTLEGDTSAAACYQKQCPAPLESEYITNQQGACDSSSMATAPFTYHKAGTTPLAIGANKTILGLGPSATIKGKGFTLKGGVSNIVIRNLTITEINPQLVWGGDAITIDGADRVWIDHVRFSLVGRQMIVTGFGKASNVTLSWNEFDGRTPYAAYCDGAHYWVWLILGADDSISFLGNWIHDTSGRAPHAGGMKNATNLLHLANNYFEHVSGHAANPITSLAKLLLEGNYFDRVTTPIQVDTSTAPAPGLAFAPIDASATTDSACQAALKRKCVNNVALPRNGTFPLDQQVLTAAGSAAAGAVVTPFAASGVPNCVPHLAGPGHL